MFPNLDELLARWEESYKKGLLSFWLLLLLDERPTYAFETAARVAQASGGTVSADENSIYRALNRFEEMGLVSSALQASPQGAARRYYTLSAAGRELLRRFITRNILVFQQPEAAERIRRCLEPNPQGDEHHDPRNA